MNRFRLIDEVSIYLLDRWFIGWCLTGLCLYMLRVYFWEQEKQGELAQMAARSTSDWKIPSLGRHKALLFYPPAFCYICCAACLLACQNIPQ